MNTAGTFKQMIFNTRTDNKLVFLRMVVGLIFISEGIQKYLFLEVLGPAFFQEHGFLHAYFWAYFTGAFEITCGLLVLVGFATRLASIPLLIIMITAFFTTRIPVLKMKGFWSFAHDYNLDFSLTVLLVLLVLFGAGNWSLDSRISPAED